MNENARKDLKEGLLLYNTENNVGLKNAWNIIQAEVSDRAGHEEGRRGLRESCRVAHHTADASREGPWGLGEGEQDLDTGARASMGTGK